MRISQINYCLKVGGAETMTVELCRIFRDGGHEVRVHCLAEDGPLGERLRGEGFGVSYHGPANPLATARSLYRTLREFRPDVAHIHNTGAMIIAAPVARLAGVPVIVGTRHGLGHARERLATLLYFGLAAACCSRVVGVCRAVTERMARQPFVLKRRLATILNGAAAAPLTAPESELRRHSFTLLWLGRLSEPKDPFTLLRAWAEVRRTVPDCHLLVAGDGELRAPSELLARQLGIEANVSFLGMRRDVGALLAASDAFVLSSKMEGLPISMIEAMAAGLPCVGTDAGGVRELIGDADCGAVTPVGDAAALASAIAACAGDAALRERWGQSARRHYFDRFTPRAMAERYLALYRELGRL